MKTYSGFIIINDRLTFDTGLTLGTNMPPFTKIKIKRDLSQKRNNFKK